MQPGKLSYTRAASPEEALGLLHEGGQGARVIAGGQALIPVLRSRVSSPRLLVDVAGIDEWRYAHVEADRVIIGAGARLESLRADPAIGSAVGLLVAAVTASADPHVRNQATLGGAVASAARASGMGHWGATDVGCALRCLDAVVTTLGPDGLLRDVLVDEYLDSEQPAAGPHLVTRVSMQAQPAGTWHYEKLTFRAHTWPVLSVAVRCNGSGWSLTLAGQGVRGHRCTEAEMMLDAGGTCEEAARAERTRLNNATTDSYVRRVGGRILARAVERVTSQQ